MDGHRFCCRYSLITNELGFCGPPHSAEKIKQFILGSGNADKLLTRFEALYPYLQIISEKHDLGPFDQSVVEAYWIGNELSTGYKKADLGKLISLLGKRGLPKSLCTRLLDGAPEEMPFTHNFHVFYVGVGRTTNSLPQTASNIDKCMISHGVVKETGDDFLIVDRQDQEKRIVFDPELLSAKVGDIVSIHWEHAVQVISQEQRDNLERLTREVRNLCSV